MKITSPAQSLSELDFFHREGVNEVLLGHKELSRFGKLDLNELSTLAKRAKELGMRTILEWDILMTDLRLEAAKHAFHKIDLSLFDAVRVQDPGALSVVKKIPSNPNIQLILETGNHNLEGVKRWCETAGERLERVILSNELTGQSLGHYIQNLSTPVEVMGLGPILLFYTPRYLLSFQKKDLSWLENEKEFQAHRLNAIANAEEGFHRGFRLIENQHGTFMFHAKDYCLIDRLDQLNEMKLGALRIDLRMNPDLLALSTLSSLIRAAQSGSYSREAADEFIKSYPQKVTRCFFQANSTDVLFKKLSNEKIVRHDDRFVGEVVEVSKERYLLIHVQSNQTKLKKDQIYVFTTPEGKIKEVTLHRITDLDRKEVNEASKNDFVTVPYHKSITTQTMIYAKE